MPEKPQSDKIPPREAATLKALAGEKAGALEPGDSVHTAGERMRDHAAAQWPVVEDRKLVGMVNETNPDWNLGGHGHDPKAWKVGDIMSRETLFCYEDESCVRALGLMKEHGLQYLPVVDREMRIVGIFTRDEIGGSLANVDGSKPGGAGA